MQEFIICRLTETKEIALSDKERGRQALLAGGLLTELGSELKQKASKRDLTLEEARQILSETDV